MSVDLFKHSLHILSFQAILNDPFLANDSLLRIKFTENLACKHIANQEKSLGDKCNALPHLLDSWPTADC